MSRKGSTAPVKEESGRTPWVGKHTMRKRYSDPEFHAWEQYVRSHVLQVKAHPEGLSITSIDEKVDQAEEKWAQRYVKENHKQLGFVKIDGPHPQGPDFRVSIKKRWFWAEVETNWRNYRKHEHHLDPSFDRVKYLILLSTEDPPQNKLRDLPSRIIHIDQEHFLSWFKDAVSGPQMKGLRIKAIAGYMQEHWVEICGDKNRDMATCPSCDVCAYFGEGIFGEASPFFWVLANKFIALHALTEGQELDLRAINRAALQRFVEQNPPG